MAMIKCSECGRAISDKADACVGCGAPISHSPDIDMAPKADKSPPPTAQQIKRRAIWFLAMFVIGVVWAKFAERGHDGSRFPVLIAALLIIAGLSGLLVSLVHAVTSRKD
jgi:hypothetical protein